MIDETKEKLKLRQKRDIAIWFNLPLDTYLNHTDEELAIAQSKMEEYTSIMLKHQKEFESWWGFPLLNDPLFLFVYWQKPFTAFAKENSIVLPQAFVKT